MTTMNEFAKELIIDRISDFIGKDEYLSDLSFLLTDEENANGSIFCDSEKSLDFIIENIDEARNFVIECTHVYLGEDHANILTKPELFTVQWLIFEVNKIINESEVLLKADEESEYNTVEITEELVSNLKKEFNL